VNHQSMTLIVALDLDMGQDENQHLKYLDQRSFNSKIDFR